MTNGEPVIYRFGSFSFRADKGELSGPRGSRSLRPQLARLLEYLLKHPGQVLDRKSVARAVWGDERVVEFEAGLAALIKELRRALEDNPSAPRYLETIPRRGLLWLATPEEGNGPGDAAASARTVLGRRGWLTVVTAVSAILLAGVFALLLMPGLSSVEDDEDDQAHRLPRVAVLPFLSVDEADREQRASLLLADSSIAALASVAAPFRDDGEVRSDAPFAVIGRTSISTYSGEEELAMVLARDIGVDLVVEGSYRREGDVWLVNVSVVKVRDQTILLSRTFLVPELSSRAVREHLQGFAIEMADTVRRCGRDCLAT